MEEGEEEVEEVVVESHSETVWRSVEPSLEVVAVSREVVFVEAF